MCYFSSHPRFYCHFSQLNFFSPLEDSAGRCLQLSWLKTFPISHSPFMPSHLPSPASDDNKQFLACIKSRPPPPSPPNSGQRRWKGSQMPTLVLCRWTVQPPATPPCKNRRWEYTKCVTGQECALIFRKAS